jgi:hypothetical protein
MLAPMFRPCVIAITGVTRPAVELGSSPTVTPLVAALATTEFSAWVAAEESMSAPPHADKIQQTEREATKDKVVELCMRGLLARR